MYDILDDYYKRVAPPLKTQSPSTDLRTANARRCGAGAMMTSHNVITSMHIIRDRRRRQIMHTAISKSEPTIRPKCAPEATGEHSS